MNYNNILIKSIAVLVLSIGFVAMFDKLAIADDTGANVHIKVEASTDNGVSWKNYSGTEFSGNETIVANPGDKILVRTKIWNSSGLFAADNITGTTQNTNPSYITSALEGVDGSDADGDGTSFDTPFFVGDGNGSISSAYVFGEENDVPGGGDYGQNCQGLLTSFTLSNDFPSGQTVILAQATVNDYTDREIQAGFLNKIKYAKAADIKSSAIRITVGEAAQVEVTGAPATTNQTTVAATLPQTGPSKRNYLIILFLMAPTTIAGFWFLLSKKSKTS